MATSGSINFSLTREQIITRALQTAEIIGLEDSASDAEKNYASDMLNMMIKEWQAEGYKLWKRHEAILFLAKATQSYSVSSTGWNITKSYVNTTLSAAEALGQTELSITSTSGMTASDFIGIELDDGTRQWTTIVSVDSPTQVTVNTALTSAAASGNTVVSYTTKLNRPLKILNARRYHLTNDVYVPLDVIRYEDYKDISKKSASGTPSQVMYDKQDTAGIFYVWPVASSVKEVIYFTCAEVIEDLDSASDNVDFPQEWLSCLVFGLAAILALKFEKPTWERFETKALSIRDKLTLFDNDDESIHFSPSFR